MSSDSVQERIMQFLQNSLETMLSGEPVQNPYAITFNTVQREPLSDDMMMAKYVAYLFDETAARQRATDPTTYAEINCVLAYAVIVEDEENPSTLLNLVASEVERRLLEDVTCGGLSYDIVFTKDTKIIGWRFDRSVEGEISFLIKFRYNTSDPRKTV